MIAENLFPTAKPLSKKKAVEILAAEDMDIGADEE